MWQKLIQILIGGKSQVLLLIILLIIGPSHYKNNKKKGKTTKQILKTETIGNRNRPKAVIVELSETDFKIMTLAKFKNGDW